MMKLLLIDDDAFLRDMYATKFTQAGYEVATADSGSAALRMIEHDQAFEVILLDMVMPGMSGVELIRTISEQFPDMHAKCIVLSNQGQEADITEAREAGAVGYIIKAESVPSDVLTKVEKLAAK